MSGTRRPRVRGAARDGYETVIVGGGLHGGLAAAALLARRDGGRVALVERGERLAGNHTWCFFGSDLTREEHALVAPFVAARWDGYDVRFPRLVRTLPTSYHAISSERFDAALRERFAAAPEGALFLGQDVTALDGDGVTLADGRRIEAERVIDARGPARPASGLPAGWQTFLGLEVRVAPAATGEGPLPGRALVRPIVMDATVAQEPGYRFFYVLPLAADRLLVEETYFGDTPALDEARLEASIRAYAAAEGWTITAVVRRERGALPMPWGGDSGPDPGAKSGPLAIGYRGGWFHPGTGYSLPFAARVACRIAASRPDRTHRALAPLARAHRRQAAFARALNFGLFQVVRPRDRWRLLERFHRLPDDTIARFYRLDLTLADRARLLAENVPEIRALVGGLGDRIGRVFTPGARSE